MLQDPHHVYLDLDVISNDYTTNGTRPYLRFEEIRNTPFLDGDSAEYLCSIVRFLRFRQEILYRCLFPASYSISPIQI